MKRLSAILVLILFLFGCSAEGSLEKGMALRERIQSGKGCCFDVVVTADYGDQLYEFSMQCITDQSGDLTFTVTKPDSISGISGIIRGSTGELTFDDKALAFQTLADGYISPVSAPWVFIHTLRSGYLKSEGDDGEMTRLAIDDSYEEEALHLDIWLNSENIPVRGDIVYKGRRCLVLDVSNFSFL